MRIHFSLPLLLIVVVIAISTSLYERSKQVAALEGYLHDLHPNMTPVYIGSEVQMRISPLDTK